LGKRVSCTKKTGGPILTNYTSYDAILYKQLPFGDYNDCTTARALNFLILISSVMH